MPRLFLATASACATVQGQSEGASRNAHVSDTFEFDASSHAEKENKLR